MKRTFYWLLVYILIASLMLTACGQTAPAPEEAAETSETPAVEGTKTGDPLKVAFIYAFDVGDYGWIYQHDQARREVDEKLDFIETAGVENVPTDAEAARVFEDLISDGYEVIVATSYSYQQTTLELAEQHPEVIFLNSTGDIIADNVGSYYGKTYHTSYVAGVLAGLMTETNILGYVGGNSIPTALLEVNAMVMGAREVNPDITLKPIWINTWNDPALEREAALSLMDLGADVIKHDTNSAAVHQAAQERGVYSVGENSDFSEYAPDAFLTGAMWSWAGYYEEAFTNIYNGTWEPEAFWGDMTDGTVSMAPYGHFVPEEYQAIANEYLEEILAGEEVFVGPIYDNQGNLQVEEGQAMTDEEMRSIDWYIQGVDESAL